MSLLSLKLSKTFATKTLSQRVKICLAIPLEMHLHFFRWLHVNSGCENTHLAHLELKQASFLLHLLGDLSPSDFSTDHPVLLGVLSLLLLYLCTDTKESGGRGGQLFKCLGRCGCTWSIHFRPLTTWLRSPSMLCQKASLCPAETQKDKSANFKEVSLRTELFVDLRPRTWIVLFTILSLKARSATVPLLVPSTWRVH